MQYWPWWIGALALGSVTVVFVLLIHRMMGVSSSWASVVNWREEREQQQMAAAAKSNAAAMNNALLAATLAQFGHEQTSAALAGQGVTLPPAGRVARPSRTNWTAHLTFLIAIATGGFLAAVSSDRLQLAFDLGASHTRLFGEGWQEWLVLIGGGVLVGFGTQMGGGCTSGHALSGVSRLTASSVVATAIFFGAAAAVSYLLEFLLS